MPLIIEYSKKKRVQIICLNIFKFEKVIQNKFPLLMNNENIIIKYREDIYVYDLFKKLLIPNKIFYKVIVKIISKFTDYSKIKLYCDNSSLIYSCNHLVTDVNNEFNFIYKYSKQSKAAFVGVPLVPWPVWYQNYLFEFDYFLCNTKSEQTFLSDSFKNVNLLSFGCPQFEKKYLDLYEKYFPMQQLKHKEKIALIIMVNTYNPLYINYKNIYNDIRDLINFLEKNGYKCIVKLHPNSQNHDYLMFKEIGVFRDYFIYNSLESIIPKVDISISYLSTSLLKCVANEIPSFSYLPKSFLETFPDHEDLNGISFQNFYFKTNNFKKPRLHDFCHVIDKPDDIMLVSQSDREFKYNNFLSIFRPIDSTQNIINYFNSSLKYEN
jgi:hypothetical protein